MIERILNIKNNLEDKEALERDIIKEGNARFLFLYLYYVDSSKKEMFGKEILKTKDMRYIHFFLRAFQVKNYREILNDILKTNQDARYLYNLLFDLDYLDHDARLAIINQLFTLENKEYILKAVYYYFVILNLYDEKVFIKSKTLLKQSYSIEISKENYKEVLESILTKANNIEEPKCFSPNCYRGHKDFIPNIIVCHTNNTYGIAIQKFYDVNAEVSSHFMIRKDGYVKQIVSLDDSAWANGTSLNTESDVYYKFSTSNLINTVKDNANYFTFSIEHESFDGTLTEEQFESTIQVMKKIIHYVEEKYKIDFPIDREHIIGHSEINPIVRTKCPGSNFPFDRIIKVLKKEK